MYQFTWIRSEQTCFMQSIPVSGIPTPMMPRSNAMTITLPKTQILALLGAIVLRKFLCFSVSSITGNTPSSLKSARYFLPNW